MAVTGWGTGGKESASMLLGSSRLKVEAEAIKVTAAEQSHQRVVLRLGNCWTD